MTRLIKTLSEVHQPLRVLHIVESFSAGVATAIEAYLDHSPADDLVHIVAGYRRPSIQIGDEVDKKAEFLTMPGSKARQVAFIARTITDVNPDVVHLHSSWAGVFARTLPMRLPPVVYTPHAFPFDRRDLSRPAIHGFALVERALAHRTDILAGCSRNEVQSAHELGGHRHITHLPYVLPKRVTEQLRARAEQRRRRHPRDGALRVACVGRLGPQKGVPFFLEVVADVRQRSLVDDVEWTWIGGGEPEIEAELRAAGVRVTGWVEQRDVLDELANAEVYLHTAAWEGMPLTILEALTMGLPAVARDIPALSELGLSMSSTQPRGVADHLVKLTAEANYVEAVEESAAILDDRLSGDSYGERLVALYRDAAGIR